MVRIVKSISAIVLTVALGCSSAAAPASTEAAIPDATILIAGDLLGPYKTKLDPADPALAGIRQIIARTDAAFANQEGSSFALESFRGSVAAENGGGYPIHTLATMRAIRALGFTMLSRANNHATDWGIDGLTATDDALDAIGFVHAGTGASLTAARAPAYLESKAGKIGLVATASTFPGNAPAGDPMRGAGARPGLNPLHVEPVTLVTAAEMRALRAIALRGGWQGYDLPGKTTTDVHLNDKLFRIGKNPGLTFDVSAADRAALLDAVQKARVSAGQVVFSIHAHETLSGGYEDSAPADFLQPLFHDVIDRGATIVTRSGPHSLQGIEIYHGRPIFYGLGHMFFELPRTITIAGDGPNKQIVTSPEDWWEGAVATVRYAGGKLAEIRVYPLDIESDDGPRHGLPRLAVGAKARAILARIQERSTAFGTNMRIAGDIGIIDRF